MDPLTWRSEFTIFNVTNTDYGDYECVAKNSEGSSRHRILLDVKSRPDTPTQLQVCGRIDFDGHTSFPTMFTTQDLFH